VAGSDVLIQVFTSVKLPTLVRRVVALRVVIVMTVQLVMVVVMILLQASVVISEVHSYYINRNLLHYIFNIILALIFRRTYTGMASPSSYKTTLQVSTESYN
jgi:hypothetical protein